MSGAANLPEGAGVIELTGELVDQPGPGAARVARAPILGLLGRSLHFGRTRIAVAMLALVAIIALVGPYLTPKAPNSFVATPFHPPVSGAPFGTDSLGRDVLSRFLAGGRLILAIAAAATLLGVAVGTLVGITAAYARSIWDDVLMRVNDVFLAFPMIVFALLVVSTVGTKPWLLIVTVAASTAPRVARIARGAALEIVDREFVKASELFGERRWAILVRELLPNIASPLLVETSLRLTYSIGVVAALGFLGFGIQPPNPDWGLMIKENQSALAVQPWPVVLPIAAIAVLTIGMNLFADGLARALVGIERGDRESS
jgi:peptide/nickel transport system permease protein